SWVAVAIGSFGGCVLLLLGVVLAEFVRSLASRQVDWHEHGFRSIAGNAIDDVPWESVTLIRETLLYERPPILVPPFNLLLPSVRGMSYTVHLADGRTFMFDGNSVREIKRFGALLRQQAERTGLLWRTVEEHG